MKTKKQMALENAPSGFPHGFSGPLSDAYRKEKDESAREWWVIPFMILAFLFLIFCAYLLATGLWSIFLDLLGFLGF